MLARGGRTFGGRAYKRMYFFLCVRVDGPINWGGGLIIVNLR